MRPLETLFFLLPGASMPGQKSIRLAKKGGEPLAAASLGGDKEGETGKVSPSPFYPLLPAPCPRLFPAPCLPAAILAARRMASSKERELANPRPARS